MAKKKIKAEVKDTLIEPKRIEAVKMGDTRIGMSTLNAMNKVTGQLIDYIYILEERVAALEAKKD